MNQLVKCLPCKGTGKMTINVSEYGKPGTNAVQIDCIHCQGTGEISEEKLQSIKDFRKKWCRGKKDYGVYFVDDGENKEIEKHHYRCNHCKKVVQIG